MSERQAHVRFGKGAANFGNHVIFRERSTLTALVENVFQAQNRGNGKYFPFQLPKATIHASIVAHGNHIVAAGNNGTAVPCPSPLRNGTNVSHGKTVTALCGKCFP